MKHLSDVLKQYKSICWYPSSGKDFRDVFYLSRQYFDVKEPLFTEVSYSDELPDLFLHTCMQTEYDSYGNSFGHKNILEKQAGEFLYRDERSVIEIQTHTDLERLGRLSRNERFFEFDDAADHGKAVLYKTMATSRYFGDERTWEIPILYICAENLSFAMEYLVPNAVNIKYTLNINYGDRFGGSLINPTWLLYITDILKTKYLLTNEFQDLSEADIEELKKLYGDRVDFDKKLRTPSLDCRKSIDWQRSPWEDTPAYGPVSGWVL